MSGISAVLDCNLLANYVCILFVWKGAIASSADNGSHGWRSVDSDIFFTGSFDGLMLAHGRSLSSSAASGFYLICQAFMLGACLVAPIGLGKQSVYIKATPSALVHYIRSSQSVQLFISKSRSRSHPYWQAQRLLQYIGNFT